MDSLIQISTSGCISYTLMLSVYEPKNSSNYHCLPLIFAKLMYNRLDNGKLFFPFILQLLPSLNGC